MWTPIFGQGCRSRKEGHPEKRGGGGLARFSWDATKNHEMRFFPTRILGENNSQKQEVNIGRLPGEFFSN